MIKMIWMLGLGGEHDQQTGSSYHHWHTASRDRLQHHTEYLEAVGCRAAGCALFDPHSPDYHWLTGGANAHPIQQKGR